MRCLLLAQEAKMTVKPRLADAQLSLVCLLGDYGVLGAMQQHEVVAEVQVEERNHYGTWYR